MKKAHMSTLQYLYAYRYIIGLLLLLVGVVLNINGSSIANWNYFIHENNTGLLMGMPRMIRTDEWGVFTPMIASQFSGDKFSWFSNILRADKTDVFMVYALPVKTILMIFRPFLTGFLFLGLERGLAFFWWGRTIFLFVVSLDFFLLFTGNDKRLSFGGALLITFSPGFQWWFSINGFAEMLIFGEGFILFFDRWMREKQFTYRAVEVLGMVWCIGGYAFVLYPSWQVAFAYVFLAFFLWVAIKNKDSFVFNKKDIIILFIGVFILLIAMVYLLFVSKGTISSVMNTAYPGARTEIGGGQLSSLFHYPGSIFFTYSQDGLPTNVSEMSVFYSFFPFCFIASIMALKKDGKDVLLILLLIIDVILIGWCVVGFPELIAKISLLSLSQSSRTVMAETYLEIMILFRAIYLIRKHTIDDLTSGGIENKSTKLIQIIAMALLAFAVVWLSRKVYGEYLGTYKLIVLFVVLFAGYTLFWAYAYSYRIQKCLLWYLICLSILTGFLVNPVQRGVGDLFNTGFAKKIRAIVKMDKNAVWLVGNNCDFPMQNYPVMMGARTINGTNTYPDIKRWRKIDIGKSDEETYNRYVAHVNATILNSDSISPEQQFGLPSPDVFDVLLTNRDVKTMHINYVITRQDISSCSNDIIIYKLLYKNREGYRIYKTVIH